MTEGQARILVVEDEPLVAEHIRTRLASLGYVVLGPVASGEEALRVSAAERPDLVLMDVVLPGGMDGVETAAELLRRDIPVVYLSAHADDVLLERAKITGPYGYLLKPCTERELQVVVVMALYRHRVGQQLEEARAELVRTQHELERKVDERTAHLAELNRRLVEEAAERAQVEQALRESERHLRQIIDLVPHRLFVKDDESRFLLVNRATAAAYGLIPEAMIGRHQRDLHGDAPQLERMLADDRAVIEKGIGLNMEETFTGPDGVPRVLRTTKIPYHIPGRPRPAVLGMAMDITEQKKNEQRLVASEQKYRALLENAVDAILLADLEGNIVDANRRAETLLGYSRDELRGMNALLLHPPEEHERVIEVFRQLAQAGNTLVEHPLLRKDGTLLRVEVAATLVHFGDQCVAQGIFRDVTGRRQQEAQRLAQEKQHRDTLVREVHHRIKNSLQGVVGLLREHASAHPELAGMISGAIAQVQSIAVIHGLLGKGDDLQVRLCDMVQAIAGNTRTLTRLNQEPEVRIALPQPVQLHKDEAVPVALVINELILNAVKHGDSTAALRRVQVLVSRVDGWVEVCVVNVGRLPAGFDYADEKGAGTGLGLVRSLLPHAGAQLRYEQLGEEVWARLQLGTPVILE